MWVCSEGADDVSSHTLAEGLGLGADVVGEFCTRHARILQEVGDKMPPTRTTEPKAHEEDEQAEVERIIQHRDHKELGRQYKVR